MNNPDGPKSLLAELPGSVRMVIVNVVVGAVMVLGGAPEGWVVTALTVGDLAVLIYRQVGSNDKG